MLAEAARSGLAAQRQRQRCGDVEVVLTDAAEYWLPDDLAIGYLFSPVLEEQPDRLTPLAHVQIFESL